MFNRGVLAPPKLVREIPAVGGVSVGANGLIQWVVTFGPIFIHRDFFMVGQRSAVRKIGGVFQYLLGIKVIASKVDSESFLCA